MKLKDIPPPQIVSHTIAVGQVGKLRPFFVVSVVNESESVVRLQNLIGRYDSPHVLMIGHITERFIEESAYTTPAVFWVSGKRIVGTRSLFVIERIFVE